jgi:hypothetical protein
MQKYVKSWVQLADISPDARKYCPVCDSGELSLNLLSQWAIADEDCVQVPPSLQELPNCDGDRGRVLLGRETSYPANDCRLI